MSFLLCYLVAFLLLAGTIVTQSPIVFSMSFAFLVIPALDLLLGPQHNFKVANRLNVHMLWMPFQLILLLAGIYFVSDLSIFKALSWAVPMGLLAGAFGISIAHELGHKYTFASRFMAKTLFVLVGFPSFPIEHNLGHHVNVATRNDPATARLGESFWAFLFRTIPAQYLDAWKIEGRRIAKSSIVHKEYGIQNEMFRLSIAVLLCIIGSFLLGGLPGLVFFLTQAVIAVFLLQAINYVEHYGLERVFVAGKLEKVQAEHSWDSNWWFTNHLLFRLQQHADHHQHAQKEYYDLLPEKEALQMPYGYPTMVILALIPPLWRKVMHKRMEKENDES
jgi:alkane 1-monooxygenase